MESQPLASRLAALFSSSKTRSSTTTAAQDYLIGLRGILVIQSFLFIFFQTFLPTAVPDSKNPDGPTYQVILRKSFSVLFCNEALIYSWFIFLSARTICVPYLLDNTREVCASSVFRRCIRLWIPTCIAYSIAAVAFSIAPTNYITEFLDLTENVSAYTPMQLRNFLVFFNSLFEIFWLNKDYSSQAANSAFPSGTLWIVSVIFQQSYTIYMTMIIIPYTRVSWRIKALVVFIAAAFWVQSWAWYSVTGLLMADAVINMDLQLRSRTGFRFSKLRVPLWPLYVAMVVTGVALQYLFISWNPKMRSNELYGHTGLYEGGMLNENVDTEQPLARVDNYLVIFGVMLLIETFEWLQKALRCNLLVALGKRSFSCFLTQSLIIYTVGIKLYLYIESIGTSNTLNNLACFCVCASAVAVSSEIFYRLVDLPSIVIAREFWKWMTK
ncbi:Nn.00g100980.m01.CDS01 [Neocucurbitaria sp. VM-36]